MRRGSRSAARDATHIGTFQVGVETDEIAIEAVDHVSNILGCHGGVGHKVGQVLCKRTEERVGEREEREVSANMVGGRVEPRLIFEPSRVDLKIVCWVTPTTEVGR